MNTILLLAACAAALTGCTGTEIAVRANSTHDFDSGVRTYAIATQPAGVADDESALYASAVERRLGQYGFTAEPATTAHYRLVLSHETRPASVGIGDTQCADDAACGAPVLPSRFSWPGAKDYVHSLTLRFFDLAEGREAYKVSVTERDRDADGRRDIDVLVASALARLPFAGASPRSAPSGSSDVHRPGDWKVVLQRDATDAAPRVTKIAPLGH